MNICCWLDVCNFCSLPIFFMPIFILSAVSRHWFGRWCVRRIVEVGCIDRGWKDKKECRANGSERRANVENRNRGETEEQNSLSEKSSYLCHHRPLNIPIPKPSRMHCTPPLTKNSSSLYFQIPSFHPLISRVYIPLQPLIGNAFCGPLFLRMNNNAYIFWNIKRKKWNIDKYLVEHWKTGNVIAL